MAEDSSLRFLMAELVDNTQPGLYANNLESSTFVSFNKVENGRVWQESNGDIRFEPAPGFVGTGYFSYTVMNSAGEIVESRATVMVQNVNDLPVLADDNFILQEGDVFSLDRLLDNDIDPEGDTLIIDHLRGLEHGEVSLVNGSLVYVPEDGYHGDVEFSYWVRDHATSYPVMANVNLTYLDVNKGATTADDRFIIVEDNVLTTSVDKLLANDVEYDSESITFTGLGTAIHGSVSLQQNGVISFAPDNDYTGNEAGFYYTVEDDTGHTTSGWVAVEVLDSREAPILRTTTRERIWEDETLTFTPEEIAKFVYDADGDALHLDIISNVSGGTIVTENGYYSFKPDTDFFGRASFDYRANDNHRGTVEGHLEFDVAAVNDPIDTGDDQLATNEEQAVSTTVNALLANDTDVDGSDFIFISLGASAYGMVTIDGSDVITFVPDADYFGDEAGFEYIVKDSKGLDSVGWVQVQVANVNDAPEIISNSLTLQEDQAITFDAATLAGFVKDVDDDNLSVTSVEAVSGGTVSEDNGVYTFTPITDYNGSGSVRVTLIDGRGETISTILALDILAQNDATQFGADVFTTLEEKSVLTTVADLLANDTDVDGPLEFVALGNAFHGSVSITSLGEITFIPDTDYFGTDAGFEYLVKDPGGSESTGQVSIRVDNINDQPYIIANTLVSSEDQIIVFDTATIEKFISDQDGDTITLDSVDSVTGGTISEVGGVYTFTPDQNYHGPASLTYSANDGQGATLSGTLNIDILSQDDPTSFGVDSFVTREEQALVVTVADLMANDLDPDGAGGLEFTGLGQVKHGQVSMAPGGIIEFLPSADYFGVEAGFAYFVRDDEGSEATGWVTIKVENENDVPHIIANRLRLYEDQSLAFTSDEVAKFITDPDGELLHLDMVSNVKGGRIELNNGVYSFIPDNNFYGKASLDYLAKNNGGEEITGQLNIDVIPVNDLPETTYFSASGVEDHEITLDLNTLMAGVNDVEDGTQLVFDGIESSLHGDISRDQQGMVHFLPDKDFFGTGFFRYNILDSEGGVGTGYVGIEVVGENDVPVAMDDEKILAWSNNSYENIFSAATFLANDYDVDHDPLAIVSSGSAEFGTVTLDGAGNIRYIALSVDWVGVDRFSYLISDGNGGFSEATATIDVKINTSPDVYSELLFTQEDIISLISQRDLLSNDSDIDGDSLQITAVDQAEHCSVGLLGDGSISFTPELNYNNRYPGQASFRYTVSDGISDPVTGVAFFDIDPVNDKPILRGERISGAVEDNSFSFQMSQLMANDTDVEMASAYETDSITFAGVRGASHGTISFEENSGSINYVPNENFYGVETFNYRVIDSFGAESVVQSEIYVKPVNDAPVVEEDIGHGAEDTIWNSYSISGLLKNDFDVDGDSLSIKNPYVMQGSAQVSISGGNLNVKPATGENRLVIGYTVTDGHGGNVGSRLTINDIREHNFAPEFSGLYRITKNYSYTDYYSSYNTTYHDVIFSFNVEDRNGGNSWGNMGDIASISAAQLHTDYQSANFKDYGQGHYGLSWISSTGPYGSGNSYATFTLSARDSAGATGTIYVDFERMHKGVGPVYHYSPVVFDLDGDGVELLDMDAGVKFDWNSDGELDPTGWVGEDDGFLVYDYDGDGLVTKGNELALKEYDPQATTDLEGLRAFDTNDDGIFSFEDAQWSKFGVWQDKNGNGQTDENEFLTLDEMNITSVELKSDENYREVEGNIVYGETIYHKLDGSTGEVADVGLNGETIEMKQEETVQNVDLSETEKVLDNAAETQEGGQENDTSLEIIAEGETLSSLDISFDDAEINRQVSQLLSDIAVCDEDEELTGYVIAASDSENYVDYPGLNIDTEEAPLSVA